MARRSRADRGSAVAKVRVYELAKEFGLESKAVMAKLQEMGEFVRSASSTIEAPVVRRLKEAFSAEAPKQVQAKKAAAPAAVDGQNGARKAPAGPGACSGRRQTLLFIAAFSSGAHHDRILLSRQCRSCRCPGWPTRAVLPRAPRTAAPDTLRARRRPAVPAGATRGQTAAAAPPARSISG